MSPKLIVKDLVSTVVIRVPSRKKYISQNFASTNIATCPSTYRSQIPIVAQSYVFAASLLSAIKSIITSLIYPTNLMLKASESLTKSALKTIKSGRERGDPYSIPTAITSVGDQQSGIRIAILLSIRKLYTQYTSQLLSLLFRRLYRSLSYNTQSKAPEMSRASTTTLFPYYYTQLTSSIRVYRASLTLCPFLPLKQPTERMSSFSKAYYILSVITLSITLPIILSKVIGLYPFSVLGSFLAFGSIIVVLVRKATIQQPQSSNVLKRT